MNGNQIRSNLFTRINKNIFRLILFFVDDLTLLRTFQLCREIRKDLASNNWTFFWEAYIKCCYSPLIPLFTYPSVEEIILKSYLFDYQSIEGKWFEMWKYIIQFKYCKEMNILRANEPAIPTKEDICNFILKISQMNLDSSHLNDIPGTLFLITQQIFKTETLGRFLSARYEPAFSVANPTNENIINVWDFADVNYVKRRPNGKNPYEYILQNPLAMKALTVFINRYINPTVGSSLKQRRMPKSEGLDEYLKQQNGKEEIINIMEGIMNCCRRFVFLAYGKWIEMNLDNATIDNYLKSFSIII